MYIFFPFVLETLVQFAKYIYIYIYHDICNKKFEIVDLYSIFLTLLTSCITQLRGPSFRVQNEDKTFLPTFSLQRSFIVSILVFSQFRLPRFYKVKPGPSSLISLIFFTYKRANSLIFTRRVVAIKPQKLSNLLFILFTLFCVSL